MNRELTVPHTVVLPIELHPPIYFIQQNTKEVSILFFLSPLPPPSKKKRGGGGGRGGEGRGEGVRSENPTTLPTPPPVLNNRRFYGRARRSDVFQL